MVPIYTELEPSMYDALARYRSHGHRFVEGWLLDGAIEATCDIAELQRQRGVYGPVCEIGVHHGRLFILLVLLNPPTERSLAIDLFELQSENVDGSGKGSREKMLEHLRSRGCNLNLVEILAENSLRVSASQIVELCHGRPRLFSVDGGHTAEITRNDLRLAQEAVCEGGVVILDDYFNSSWPAVSEGTVQFMRDDSPQLVPVIITSNKFIFAKGGEAAAEYREQLLSKRRGAKLSKVFGFEVVCYEPTSKWTVRQMRVRIRETRVGKAIRSLKRLGR